MQIVPDMSHVVRPQDVGRCLGCGERLGMEPWWVTELPHGVHTRCRDWSKAPFPFARQMNVLRRLWRAAQGESRIHVGKLGKLIREMQETWPRDADPVLVADTIRRCEELRSKLLGEGVDKKLCGQL